MVRPKADPIALEIACKFALSVTIQSNDSDDFIARQGRFSIFSLLSQIAPKVPSNLM